MAVTESILDSVKEGLGVPVGQEAFDSELTIYVNSVFSTLRQLGVGPVAGFMIAGNGETWTEFLGADELRFNDVKNYMVMRVKMIFDPPATSYALDALKEQTRESEWRLNTERESTDWVNPEPVVVPTDPYADPTLF